jgi:microcystin-dependent protein
MSHTLDALLDQAIDNYPVTATLSPEIVAVLFYALSRIEKPETWLDLIENPMDEITPTDAEEIDELVAGANMAIITPEVGFIKPYITTSPPDNTIPCDGGTYLREDYPLLYAVIDDVFIIDPDTFTTPDLRGLTLLGAGTVGARTFTLGGTGGEYEHQLTEGELASHAHSLGKTITTLVLEPGEVPALTPVPILTDFTGSTGGDEPHNNIQPYGVVKYCVQAR